MNGPIRRGRALAILTVLLLFSLRRELVAHDNSAGGTCGAGAIGSAAVLE